ncbi:hypothetical protein BM221_007739 [Beauveria bassiana]|uniref:Uncharacterized protein n=1 Tax=Beauveria bassiana TaxID=176275 RepID=A0A2N6NHH3_BEABA|nr:hypothetical protein BM221_007739 [Beauveria bassiana]
MQKEAGRGFGAAWCPLPGYNAPGDAAGEGHRGVVQCVWVADQSPIPILVSRLLFTFETLSQHSNIVGCKLSHGGRSLQLTQIASNPGH